MTTTIANQVTADLNSTQMMMKDNVHRIQIKTILFIVAGACAGILCLALLIFSIHKCVSNKRKRQNISRNYVEMMNIVRNGEDTLENQNFI